METLKRIIFRTKNDLEKWREVWIDDPQKNYRYITNRVTNTKYTILTFLPKNLFEQFGRFMNRYFLLIACLQLIPQLTPISPITTWFPLLFIFAISAIKEAIDDYKRYQLDKQANSREYIVVRDGKEVSIKSEHIRVGEIVKVTRNNEFPCDLVLMKSCNGMGTCYIETANIDGETDLKTRRIPSNIPQLAFSEYKDRNMRINCPLPNNLIYSFDANLSLFESGSQSVYALDTNQLLLQGTFLRNTESVYGIAVYTGNETKLGMNKNKPSTKLTRLDKLVDYGCLLIFTFQITLVVLFGITGNVLSLRQFQTKHIYTETNSEMVLWYQYFIIPGRMLLLFSFMIPISLKVTLDIVKFITSRFIDWDLKMYHEDTDEPAHAANTSLSEELGQIQYMFTDKTGTLTENIMLFKICSIGGVIHGRSGNDGCVLNDSRLMNIDEDSSDPLVLSRFHFFRCLSLCHSVAFSEADQKYYGSSPDEEALVSSAAKLGFEFLSKARDIITAKINGIEKRFKVLKMLEFTSSRKRMTVIIRDLDSQRIYLYVKGADDIIINMCTPGDELSRTMSHLEEFAVNGYRTLCVACKEIPADDYEKWETYYLEMTTSLEDREKKILEAFSHIEKDLTLLGASAIEDRLQTRVPETIQILRRAGIKIWMLTGDKRETAVQIGQSCNMILQDSQETHVHLESTGKSYVELKIMIDQFSETLCCPAENASRSKEFCLIIDGATLRKIFENDSCIESFLTLSLQARSVICCRVSPHQKAAVVNLVKKCNYITLSVGDGGNDVAMIQKAHVGVGIKGREGRQAARAADYSIARFEFLSRLILIHGRYAYKRTAFVALYCIYKSIFLGLMQAYYQFFCGFSGTSLFSSYALSTYNVFFTGLPIVFYALDKDIKESSVMKFPEVYRENNMGVFFGPSVFFLWLSRALLQSLIVFSFSVYQYGIEQISRTGSSDSNSLFAMLAYSSAVSIQSITIVIAHNTVFWINAVIIGGSIALYYVLTSIVSLFPNSGIYGLTTALFGDLTYWMMSLLITVCALLPFIVAKYCRINYFPRYFELIQSYEQGNFDDVSNNIEMNLSSEIGSALNSGIPTPRRKSSASSNSSNFPLI